MRHFFLFCKRNFIANEQSESIGRLFAGGLFAFFLFLFPQGVFATAVNAINFFTPVTVFDRFETGTFAGQFFRFSTTTDPQSPTSKIWTRFRGNVPYRVDFHDVVDFNTGTFATTTGGVGFLNNFASGSLGGETPSWVHNGFVSFHAPTTTAMFTQQFLYFFLFDGFPNPDEINYVIELHNRDFPSGVFWEVTALNGGSFDSSPLPVDGFPRLEILSPFNQQISSSSPVEIAVRYFNPAFEPVQTKLYFEIRNDLGQAVFSSTTPISVSEIWTHYNFSVDLVASTTYFLRGFMLDDVGRSSDSFPPLVEFAVGSVGSQYNNFFGQATTSDLTQYALEGCNVATTTSTWFDFGGQAKKALCWAFVPNLGVLRQFENDIDIRHNSILGYSFVVIDLIKTAISGNASFLDNVSVTLSGETVVLVDWTAIRAKLSAVTVQIKPSVDIVMSLFMLFYLINVAYRIFGEVPVSSAPSPLDLRGRRGLGSYSVTVPKRK